MARRSQHILSALLLAAAATPAPARSPQEAVVAFRIDARDLEGALLAIARQSGKEIVFASDVVAGRKAPPLHARLTPLDAVHRVLQGSGLVVRPDGEGLVVVTADAGAAMDTDIIVAGSRIRGGQRFAPVTSVSRSDLKVAGVADLGQAIRNVPQNFSGGQSPYVGTGAEGYGSDNVNSSTTVNLRGLGPDATLTLLNGHRISYSGVAEGVDISSIPLAAIERIEIVADGASAIYGSDAVAGVANVVLRRDYRGVDTSARLAAATRGGDVQQQLEAVAGTTWSDGGFVATATYDHNSAITAGQRGFARTVDASTTILPRLDHVSAVASGHQSLGPSVEVGLDLLYSHRTSLSTLPNTLTAGYRQSGIDRRPVTSAFAAAPSVQVRLGGDWNATVSGSYARDDTRYRTRYFDQGAVLINYAGSYRDETLGGEGSVEGRIIDLPGGAARLAAGLGYRRVELTGRNQTGQSPPTGFTGARDDFYAFGEVTVPLVGKGNARPGVSELGVNLAGRFEHYPSISDIFTPKVGLLYAPFPALRLRGTWGRSFKAPTLIQLYQGQNAFAIGPAYFGGSGYPADATAVYAYGGNPALRPQRARSWSVGAELSPFRNHRASIEATYFNTRYVDRIVAPIVGSATVLANPVYADLVQRAPSAAALQALVAGLEAPLSNFSGIAYDPGKVVAIIDNRNRNVASQSFAGVDVSARWRLDLATATSVTLTAATTYLTSRQRLIAGQDEVTLAGRIFYPPRFKGRAGSALQRGGWTAGGFVTVIGGVDDVRFATRERVRGQAMVDLTLGYQLPRSAGPLAGLSVQLAATNALDSQPQRIRNAYGPDTPFDSTNYDPVGRLLAVTVSRQW